jgi:hypothetical protein
VLALIGVPYEIQILGIGALLEQLIYIIQHEQRSIATVRNSRDHSST